MKFFTILSFAASLAAAQHGKVSIPAVDALVSDMLKNYTDFVHFDTNQVSTHVVAERATCDFWMETIPHQGIAAFNPNASTYQVFRNVKNFGAKGDGVTDDTAAINAAIAAGNRCAPGKCPATTITPAVVYFPAGTYMISASIISYYYTQMIGNPNCLPVIKATAGFNGGLGLIDANQYQAGGVLGYGATNLFWRQIRNLIIDTTSVPATSSVTGIHWPVGQATSIQNVQFKMSSASNSQHQGIFIESGSGGFMGDLTFSGGLYGLSVGNQQFTSRNLVFNNVNTAINQFWDWGWTYQGLSINNCKIGIAMDGGAPNGLSVSSMTVVDSSITNTPIFVKTGRSASAQPPAANAVILENIKISNVPTVVQNYQGVVALAGTTGSATVAAWGQGSTSYTPNGPTAIQGNLPVSRPSALVSNGNYFARSKPQYTSYTTSQIVSARSQGAKGDGVTDDTAALQRAIMTAASSGKLLYIDHGDYLVSKTIYIPSGSRIVGETFPVILSYGSFFNDINNPQPVVQVGKPGESGWVSWSDTIVSTRGGQAGAVLIQYNLAATMGAPGGLWDVHTRIGGFAGSQLQLAQCPKTPNVVATAANIPANCIAAFMSLHATKGSAALYLENVWLWVADHDVEDANQSQITVYAGRGFLDESTNGPVWLVGTSSEHHVMYQYQLSNTKNVYAGQIQTETAYFQPNPPANLPFPSSATYNDPTFPSGAAQTLQADNLNIPTADGWALRVVNSSGLRIYGAGFYSFFNNNALDCSNQNAGSYCQAAVVSIEGASSSVVVENLNTVGAHWAYNVSGTLTGKWSEGQAGFVQNFVRFATAT